MRHQASRASSVISFRLIDRSERAIEDWEIRTALRGKNLGKVGHHRLEGRSHLARDGQKSQVFIGESKIHAIRFQLIVRAQPINYIEDEYAPRVLELWVRFP